MRIISGVLPRTNMDRFYVEMSILTVKRIYNYSIGLFMYKYVNKMTPDVFDNFFRKISDMHQHNARNVTQKQFYITSRGTTRGQKTFSYCGPHILNFIIKNINPNCAIGSFKKMSRQLFIVANVMLNNSLHYAVFLLGDIFHCRQHWNLCYLTNSIVAGGVSPEWWLFLSFFLFGVHVQFMETYMYVCI